MKCTHAWTVASECPKCLRQELNKVREVLVLYDRVASLSQHLNVARSILLEFVRVAGFTRLDLRVEFDTLHIWLWKGHGVWPVAVRFPREQHEPVALTLIAKAKEALLAKFRSIETD